MHAIPQISGTWECHVVAGPVDVIFEQFTRGNLRELRWLAKAIRAQDPIRQKCGTKQ